MHIDSSILVVIITSVFGGGTLLVAILQGVLGRGSRKADVSDRSISAADKMFDRYDEQIAAIETKANQCEARLNVTERLRNQAIDEVRRIRMSLHFLVQAIRSGSQTHIDSALDSAEEVLNSTGGQ